MYVYLLFFSLVLLLRRGDTENIKTLLPILGMVTAI